MKTLKFNTEKTEMIENGLKTTTWRVFDDKDLTVGDELKLINSDTKEMFGYATIDEIITKRIETMNDIDRIDHPSCKNNDDVVKMMQTFYGNRIDNKTIVKVVKFIFHQNSKNVTVVTKVTNYKLLKVYCDGGSRGNPGPSATGYVVINEDEGVVVKGGDYIGVTTNNQAEYQAVRQALEACSKLSVKILDFYLDSLLVVNQINGIYKIKNRDLWPIHEAICDLKRHFKKVTFTHIPREMNKDADAIVNRVLDEQNN